jgi:hypothetical protein
VDSRLEPAPVVAALGEALSGIVAGLYVGGSLATGDYHPSVSDIDAVPMLETTPRPALRNGDPGILGRTHMPLSVLANDEGGARGGPSTDATAESGIRCAARRHDMSMHNANMGSPQGRYTAEPPTGLPDTSHHGPSYTHRRAVPALLCGVLSVLLLGLVTGIPAILMGRKAMRDIDASDGQIQGRGTALVGLVLGIIGTALSVLLLVIWILQR